MIRIPNGDVIASRRFAQSDGDAYGVGDVVVAGFLEGDAMTFEYPPHGLRNELEIS